MIKREEEEWPELDGVPELQTPLGAPHLNMAFSTVATSCHFTRTLVVLWAGLRRRLPCPPPALGGQAYGR